MVAVRDDVECLFRQDHLPRGAFAVYDTHRVGGGPTRVVNSVTRHLDAFEVQDQVVEKILRWGRRSPILRPFTLVRAHEHMENLDLRLDALLVHPDFAPLLTKVQRVVFGIQVKLFGHFNVPEGEIYALPEPEYLGVVSYSGDRTGVCTFNPKAILRGAFPRARAPVY